MDWSCVRRLVVVMLLLASSADLRADPDIDKALSTVHADMAGLKDALGASFGANWTPEALPSEVARQLRMLSGVERELTHEFDYLANVRRALIDARAEHARQRSDYDARGAGIDRQLQALDQRESTWSDRVADYGRRNKEHTAHPCMAPANRPDLCADYRMAQRKLQEENASLRIERDQIDAERADLTGRKREWAAEAVRFKEWPALIQQQEYRLTTLGGSWVAKCEGVSMRAVALTQVLRNATFKGRPEAPPSYSEEAAHLFKSLGQEAIVQMFRVAVWEQPYVAVAFVLADALHADMDDRSKEIADNTFLLADYAAAMQRLKRDGQLKPGQRGYEALRQMNAELGREMPSGEIAFTWDAMTKSDRALENFLSAAAKLYAGHLSDHAGERAAARVMKEMSPMDKKVLGAAGRRYANGAVQALTAGSAMGVLEGALKASGDALEERRRAEIEEFKK